MGTLSDKRTIAGLAPNASASFFHGLGKVPDVCQHRFITTLPSNVSAPLIAALVDVTGVTIQNCGGTNCPNMEVLTYTLHSILV